MTVSDATVDAGKRHPCALRWRGLNSTSAPDEANVRHRHIGRGEETEGLFVGRGTAARTPA